jgi:hypothetical protein
MREKEAERSRKRRTEERKDPSKSNKEKNKEEGDAKKWKKEAKQKGTYLAANEKNACGATKIWRKR